MLSAAHAAPSVGLSQPWDFVVVTDPETRRGFHAHVQVERDSFAATLEGERAGTFAGIKIDGVTEASLSVVVTYDPDRGRRASSVATPSPMRGSTRSASPSRICGSPAQQRAGGWGGCRSIERAS